MWFGNFFKKEDPLITALKKHHKELFKIYLKIAVLVNKNKFDKIPSKLNDFYYKYKQHIIYEDNYFYAKLNEMYKNDTDKKIFIRNKREDMDKITVDVEKFIKDYTTIEKIRDNLGAFKREFQRIGAVLKSRVDFEESELYVLYK
ncbi:hemerythrin domain-containing protein [Caminibacter pacificus]|uniref:Hemerythrin HHE cation binding domain-containing protein n=1 Tax=Caminibacter pacificus TaxID=1424653 RepID=A0AAJ4UXB5_9BACT|nr:hemerythrin domain-containing protein [Caminibacter pacificus]QCI27465.1 hemerythrin domain-containing protein [Caminibacter pacificus]ROR38902.1 hemerythrin HHE cation binding domain-containing protein [Caminibacter pacificus]